MRRLRNGSAQTSGPTTVLQSDTGDVEFLLGQTGEWIRAADTKAGLLLAALTVLLGGISSSARNLRGLWSAHRNHTAALTVLAISVVLLAIAYALLIALLLPHRSSPTATRYAWPWVHKTALRKLESLPLESRRKEAWVQAKQLASIASRKLGLFTAAVWASTASTACFLGWSVLRP